MVYLLAIMGRSPVSVLEAFCARFQLPHKSSDFLIRQKSHADKTANYLIRRQSAKNSEIYWLLQELSIEGLLYLMSIARKSTIRKAVSNYVTDLREEAPLISGTDLMQMGYTPGPMFKEILNTILDRRLDGEVRTREEEITLIRAAYPAEALDESPSDA